MSGHETGMVWVTFPLSRADLSLERTLASGQAFRWRRAETKNGEEWTGAIGHRSVYTNLYVTFGIYPVLSMSK